MASKGNKGRDGVGLGEEEGAQRSFSASLVKVRSSSQVAAGPKRGSLQTQGDAHSRVGCGIGGADWVDSVEELEGGM